MAAFLGAPPSLNSCASLTIRGSKSLPLAVKSRQACASFPFTVTPLRIARERRPGVVLNSYEAASSVEEEEFEAPVKDTGVKDMVNKEMADANLEFSEMDLEEAALKYSLQEQLFTEVDYAQPLHSSWANRQQWFGWVHMATHYPTILPEAIMVDILDVINAFTDRAFSGNPAAVIFLPYERDDRWLQTIAREFNQTTAFLVKRYNTRNDIKNQKRKGLVQVDESGTGLKANKTFDPLPVENEFDLRWFSPTVELDLCGHATLASAHLLFSARIVEGDTALFHTKSGILKANKISGYPEFEETPEDEDDSSPPVKSKPSEMGVVQLEFPMAPAAACNDASLLSEALGGVDVKWVGRSSLGDYLVELQSSEDVENVNPKFEKMLGFSGRGGVIVTAPAAASSEYDFMSRFFCPKLGINEDPATGSAHCTLGPYWASKLGKTELNAYQASMRGGKFVVRVDEEAELCYLEGGAVLVMLGICLNTKQI